MILAFIFVACILMGAGFLSYRLRINLILALPVAVFTYSLSVYFLSILGLLRFFELQLYLMFVLFLVLSIIELRKVVVWKILRKYIQLSFLGEFLGLALPFVLFFTAVDQGWKFVNWDELSGWGPAIDTIYRENRIWNSLDFLFNKTYPPLQQVYQLLPLKIFGWNESWVLIANNSFILLLFLCIASAIHRSNRKAVVLFFYLQIAVFYTFGFNFKSVFADSILAVFFAAGVILAIHLPANKSYIFILSLFSGSATLLKPTGIFFGLIVGIFAAIKFTNDKGNKVPHRTSTNNKRRKSDRNLSHFNEIQGLTISPVTLRKIRHEEVILVLAPIITWLTWQLYLAYWKFPRTLIEPDYFKIFTEAGLIRLESTLLAFHNALARPIPDINIGSLNPLASSYFLTLLLFAIHLFVSKKAQRSSGFKINEATIFLIAWVAYQFLLIFSYFYFFTEYEGVRVASMSRYVVGFYFAWVVFLIYRAFSQYKTIFATTLGVGFLAFLFALSLPLQSDIKSIQPDKVNLEIRNQMDDRLKIIRNVIGPSDRVYIIDQNTTGYAKNLFYYLMLPNPTNFWCWTVGEKYYAEDVWTCPQDLSVLLKDYDYLYLHNVDEQFWKKVSMELNFEGVERKEIFYRLKHRGGQIEFEPLSS